jgi:hypothetical protein
MALGSIFGAGMLLLLKLDTDSTREPSRPVEAVGRA